MLGPCADNSVLGTIKSNETGSGTPRGALHKGRSPGQRHPFRLRRHVSIVRRRASEGLESACSGGAPVNSDSEVLAAPALAMRYETLVRMSRAIGAHRDLKELFGILMDGLHGVVQFEIIGGSLRNRDSDTFRNYFVDMGSRSEFVRD